MSTLTRLANFLICPNAIVGQFFCSILFLLLIASCNSQTDKPRAETKATNAKKAETNDSLPLPLVKEVLGLLKTENFLALKDLVHPVAGVRISPYAFVDTINDQKFTGTMLLDVADRPNKGKMLWGHYDGTGDEMRLTFEEYYAKFLYSADYLSAPVTNLNKSSATGNTVNNIAVAYPNSQFSESYFPGTDKKFNGMDWSALRLVFKQHARKWYLVGIVHDQWTI